MSTMLFAKGLLFFAVLLYASHNDLKTREIPDRTHFIILIAALISFSKEAIVTSVCGAFFVPIPFLIVAIKTKGGIGGGDVKFMAANGFFLGLLGGVYASLIGLILSIAIHCFVYSTAEHKRRSIPMAPYLSVGCFVVFIIQNI